MDPKASESTKKAIAAVIECYKLKYPKASIFMAADPVPVYWGHFSVLEVRHLTLHVQGDVSGHQHCFVDFDLGVQPIVLMPCRPTRHFWQICGCICKISPISELPS